MFNTDISHYPLSFVATPEKVGCYQRVRNVLTAPYNAGRNLIQTLFKHQIYSIALNPGFRQKMSLYSTRNDRILFRNLGAEHVIFQTTDGVRLEGFYFDVNAFKNAIVKCGGQFSVKEGTALINVFNQKLAINLEKMRVETHGKEEYSSELAEKGVPRFVVYLGKSQKAPLVEENPGVTIISGGNGYVFEFMRRDIMNILFSGQSCFAFNIRGVGRSQGSPTENGTYLDIEAAYQFLTQRKGYTNEMITAQGHCLIGGVSAYLASQKPGVNLVLDRSFCKVPEMLINQLIPRGNAQNCGMRINNFISDTLSNMISFFIVSYNNEKRLAAVTGHVCLIDSQEKDYVPEETTDRLLLKSPKATKIQLDTDHVSHWDEAGIQAYRKFLKSHHLLRTFGTTPKLSLEKRLGFVSSSK